MTTHRASAGSFVVAVLAATALWSGCADERDAVAPPTRDALRSMPAPPAMQWFDARRSGGRIAPVSARSAALAERDRHGSTDAPGAWVPAGPVNVGGRVTALGVDPTNPSRIWVGTAAGGVFLTVDEGATFSARFDDQPALSIGSLAVHPVDPDVVYVGTGEDNGAGYSYDGEGVFRTSDGGATWSALGLAETRRIGAIAIDPTDGDRLFVAAGGDWYAPDPHRGVYRSLDGGDTWTQVLFVADDAGAIDVAIDPLNPNRVFAAIWQRQSQGNTWYIGGPSSGIYRSVDGGDSWTRLSNGLPAEDMGKIGIAIAPSEPTVVYANVISPTGVFHGVYRSVDGGDTWERRDRSSVGSLYGSFGYYFSRIRAHPSDPDTVYSLDVRLLRSTNGGRTFGIVTNAAHVDWHDLIVDADGRLVAGNDGGFYVSPDEGRTWTHGDTLPITQLYDLGVDFGDPNRRFAGSQDNGTIRTTSGALDDWGEVLPNDGMHCEVDPTDPNKVYASMQLGDLHRSTDGGASFDRALDGIDPVERTNWSAPLVLDPSMPSTMYTGTIRVYRSADSMQSWTPISPDLTAHAETADTTPSSGRDHTKGLIRRTITAVEVSPVDRDVLWAGTDNGHVWVTADGGSTWNEVTPADASRWVTSVEADPRDPGAALVTVTGYRQGDRMPYVRRTEDFGATWTNVTGDLPQVPVNDVVVDDDWIGRWFAATDVGVYVTDDAGTSWSAMRTAMPYVVVLDLVRHDPSATLFAATHGRSLFAFDLLQLGPADGDGDGVDNNADCALADPGSFAVPGRVDGLVVDKGPDRSAELSWSSLASSAGSGTLYDVARGFLNDLRSSGTHDAAGALACNSAETVLSDPDVPETGAGTYYLVRGINTCGAGPWGPAPAGGERDVTVCP